MFKGSMPALVTPFKNGAVDVETLKKLVEWHIAEGSSAIVPVGTTGESPTLSHDEHQTVIEVVVKTARGRVPVIAGAGSNNTVEGISLMRFAEKVGADAALVVTPYYNRPSQEGLALHFEAIEVHVVGYHGAAPDQIGGSARRAFALQVSRGCDQVELHGTNRPCNQRRGQFARGAQREVVAVGMQATCDRRADTACGAGDQNDTTRRGHGGLRETSAHCPLLCTEMAHAGAKNVSRSSWRANA